MADAPVVDIRFPPNTTVADVQRLVGDLGTQIRPSYVRLFSAEFMPAPVVMAALQAVRAVYEPIPSFTFFDEDTVELEHCRSNDIVEARVVMQWGENLEIRSIQARVLVECASAFWPVRIMCNENAGEKILSGMEDLSRVVHFGFHIGHAYALVYSTSPLAMAHKLASLQSLAFTVLYGADTPSLVDFVAAAIRWCPTLEHLKIHWHTRGNDALKLGRAVCARRAARKLLKINVTTICAPGEEGDHVSFLREVAPSTNVSKLSVLCLCKGDANVDRILDAMRGTSTPLSLRFYCDWTDATTVRRVCDALAANALPIVSLRCAVELPDVGDVGPDMERALACNHTLRKLKFRMGGTNGEAAVCQRIMSGLMQNAFIEKINAVCIVNTPACNHFLRRMTTTRTSASLESRHTHDTAAHSLLYIFCNDPWKNTHLVCEFADGYAVQRAIDCAAACKKPRFLARMCDLSHGLPLMRGAMAEVTSISIHWCGLTL